METSRGNLLPHWTAERAIYHICFRLADSVPADKLKEWEDERKAFAAKRKNGEDLSDDEIARLRYLYSEKVEKYLDSGYGSCLLRSDGVLAVVRDTIFYNHGKTYRLHAYGIMPNHIHVCVEIFAAQDMAKIVQAWKSTLSHRINRLLGRAGELWQADYYNHIIRTAKEYEFQMKYIRGNDGVEGWRFDEVRSDGVLAVGGGCGVDGGDAVATQGEVDGEDAVATHRVGCGLALAFVAFVCLAAGACEDMFPFAIKANGKNPAMDMSFLLPAPAGRDGFVRTEGEHFVNDKGTIRFNGVNLVGAACFPDHENAERLAERLSRLGLNIVRVHYIDTWAYGSNFMKAPMAALFKKDPKSNCIVDEAQRERFEYLVAQLKKRGIYLNMNLHVAHELDERDGIPKTPWANRGPDFFYGPLIEKEKEYAREVLGHVNPYTGLALKDDPCVAMVEINNENGMFSTWANGLLDGGETFGPVYQDEFRRRWQAFSGSSKDYLRAKAPGPAYTQAETNTFFRFLAHIDETYFNTMRDCLVRELGVKVPVYATQLDYCTPHTLAKYDIVDIHLYWTHPSWGEIPKGVDLRQGPHRGVPWMFRNESMIASKRYEKPYDEDFVPHRATMRVRGRPFMVSETAAPYPNWYGAEFNPFIRALAAFQDWGAVITHSWNNDLEPEPDYTTFFFSFAGRTDCLAHFPAMAALFLRGDVKPAAERIDVNEDEETYYGRLATKGLARAGVHASPARISGGKFRSSEILMRGIGVDLAGTSEPFKPLEAKKEAEMDGGVYDNGQFRLDQSDPQHAFFLVRSPNTKFFTGFSSLRTFDLGDGVKVTPGTTKLGWCTISLVSLTGDGFGRGSRILLAATGLSHNGGAKFSHLEGSLWHSRDDDFGTATTVTEGVRAKIELPFADVRCRALDGDGVRGREVPVRTEGGVSAIEIGPEFRTVWYEVGAMK